MSGSVTSPSVIQNQSNGGGGGAASASSSSQSSSDTIAYGPTTYKHNNQEMSQDTSLSLEKSGTKVQLNTEQVTTIQKTQNTVLPLIGKIAEAAAAHKGSEGFQYIKTINEHGVTVKIRNL